MLMVWLFLVTSFFESVDIQHSSDDPHSFSRPDLVKVANIHLDLEVNFQNKILNGSVILNVEKVHSTSTTLMLDTKNLTIFKVIDDETGNGLNYGIGFESKLGSRLDIQLPKESNEEKFKIRIFYSTDPRSEALQWLETNQTTDKLLPYVFSQNHPINCRAMVPVQDTPSNKITYTAEIVADKEFTVLMSAVRGKSKTESDSKTRHHFQQKVPLAPYLIAIAVGKLESRDIGPRSKVWAEPSMAEDAAKEFSDIEAAMKTGETLFGPYEWDVFDILVLPTFFPYYGMENPCLTFVSPKVVSGDKSMIDIIHHELSHAWTGNLVSNINNNHFWLNEGFTVYLQQRISEITEGPHYRGLAGLTQWKKLKDEIIRIGEEKPATALVLDLGVNSDPMEAFTLVPYFKGQIFLRYLEDVVGKDEMTKYLKRYVQTFKYKSLDSGQFKAHFLDNFKDNPKVHEIDWVQWLHGTGMPKYKPDYDETLAKKSEMLANKWRSSWSLENQTFFKSHDYFALTGSQKLEFFSMLLDGEPISHDMLESMNDLYDLSNILNARVRYAWVKVGLKAQWKLAIDNAVDLVSNDGNVAIRAIYQLLYENKETRQLALKTFKKMRPFYFSNTVKLIETVLHLN